MRSRMSLLWLMILILVSPVLTVLNGCGNKIAIPEPDGLFGISQYGEWARFQGEDQLVDMKVSVGRVFTLTGDMLSKRDLTFGVSGTVEGLVQATAMCVDEESDFVFVWEDGLKQVSWYQGSDMSFVGSSVLPEMGSAVAMAVNGAGIDQVAGALSYLYLSDPSSLLVRRYAFDDFGNLMPHGILANSDGEAARFVHLAGGMATDIDGRLLICDTDTSRNWVLRFDSTPDVTDVASNPPDDDPLRGTPLRFSVDAACIVPPASDFVLGYAAECGNTDWVGRTSSEPGEFNNPTHVAVDASGRIYVADSNNARIQIFSSGGDLDLQFGSTDDTPGVTSVGVYDHRIGSGADDVNYGAFVFVLVPGENQILKFISSEHSNFLNEDLPPPPQ